MLSTLQNKQHHGIVAPLFSVHTSFSSGIGEYLDLIPLIDWCQKIGLDIIQLLPINDTGPIISPYSPLSAFALNPIYLSLSRIASDDSLKSLKELTSEEQIQYEQVMQLKDEILRQSFENEFSAVSQNEEYKSFLKNNPWINSYAQFKILKEHYKWTSWKAWPKTPIEINQSEIDYHAYVQFLCFSQMSTVKKYAESKGVSIKGDIPFLITIESADTWEHPDFFIMDLSAGAPPDQYNAEGQNWTAPVYNWDENFDKILDWWRRRLKVSTNFYHLYRLDHVVGLFRVWAIPEGSSPKEGYYLPKDKTKWIPQGTKILKEFLKATPMKPIAEDLGVVPDEVRKVLNQLGIPGTKVMRWEKDPVDKYPSTSMTTVSTHDTETLMEWLKGEASYDTIRNILFKSHHSASQYHINLLNEYFPLIPGFSWKNATDERINEPGKVLKKNWRYRFRPSIEEINSNPKLANEIKGLVLGIKITSGNPRPFGATSSDKGMNFAFYSHESTEVIISFFDFESHSLLYEIPLDPKQNRTGLVWHISIEGLPKKVCYAYRINKTSSETLLNDIKPEQLILDPFAKATNTPVAWGVSEALYQPLGVVIQQDTFNWEGDKPLSLPIKDLVIYEMHVRGFTKDPSSNVKNSGSFLGIIDKIPYLKDLGINAIKLLPIQEFNECEYKEHNPSTQERLFNFWGYSTVNFFSPMNRYASKNDFLAAVTEFKSLVKEMHRNGIEVILDVVFNHTAENFKDGPIYSFKGIDPSVYYMLNQNEEFKDYSGCGNTFNCNHPIVRRLILTCLEYWVSEMHVDGFRFDLASVLARGIHGEPLEESPLLDDLSQYPVLTNTKLIAEPWDMGGLYKLGSMYPQSERWSEWNDRYRDSVRRFIKGDHGEKREFASRICGSQDIFVNSNSPCSSINFVTAHDGFTLRDLVSYNQKHNLENGENDRDGNPSNSSWNCGVEGESTDDHILQLRARQMRNFHLALMISQGVPMLTMGNEYGHTRYGNNNSWCQDNTLNWFLWNEVGKQSDFFRFYRGLIRFRNEHPILHLERFLNAIDIDWHGILPFQPNWEDGAPFIAFSLKDHGLGYHLYAAFNADNSDMTITIPDPPKGSVWHIIVNTGIPSPNDYHEEKDAPLVDTNSMNLVSHSAILLKSQIQ